MALTRLSAAGFSSRKVMSLTSAFSFRFISVTWASTTTVGALRTGCLPY